MDLDLRLSCHPYLKRQETRNPVILYWMKLLLIEVHILIFQTLICLSMESTLRQCKEMDSSSQRQPEVQLMQSQREPPWFIRVYLQLWWLPFVHILSLSDQSSFLQGLSSRWVNKTSWMNNFINTQEVFLLFGEILDVSHTDLCLRRFSKFSLGIVWWKKETRTSSRRLVCYSCSFCSIIQIIVVERDISQKDKAEISAAKQVSYLISGYSSTSLTKYNPSDTTSDVKIISSRSFNSVFCLLFLISCWFVWQPSSNNIDLSCSIDLCWRSNLRLVWQPCRVSSLECSEEAETVWWLHWLWIPTKWSPWVSNGVSNFHEY